MLVFLTQFNQYIPILQISGGPNARSSSGLIQLDSSQDITFDGTLNFASYKYYVGTSVYFDHVANYYKQVYIKLISNLLYNFLHIYNSETHKLNTSYAIMDIFPLCWHKLLGFVWISIWSNCF